MRFWWLKSKFAFDRWQIVRIDRGFTVSIFLLRNIYSLKTKTKTRTGLWYEDEFINKIYR